MATVNLIGTYNHALVALSVLIAVFASYAALDLAGRVTAAGGWVRAVWLLGGACAMGTGIWSMHYIGMLAFILPISVAYHWPTVLLSLFAAILASAIALYVVSRQKMDASRAVAGSVLMGAGIAGMHYIGMAAMRLPAICHFNSLLVVLSVVLAVLISLAALWITFHFRDEKTGIGWEKLAGAVVMGAAIPVMHYTAMAAASFTPSGMPVDLSHALSISTLGTAGIAAVTFLVLGLALLTSWVDRRFAAHTLELQEEKLQRSEAYLAEAQRLSHTGSFGWKPSTGEIIWSEETFRIFQYDRTTKTTVELILQRVHPEDAALVQQTIERAAQDGKDFDHEHRLLMPDGRVKYLHVIARALQTSLGNLEFVGAVTDITERKKTEEALRRSETYLAEAQRLAHTSSWAWRLAGGDAVHLSEQWYRIYGIDPKEGMPSWKERLDRIYPEDRARWKAAVDRAIAEKSDYDVEFRIALPDNTVRYVHTVGHPVLDASGELIEFMGSSADITERKLAEEKLRRSEESLLEAQRLSHTGSWRHSLLTNEVTVSPEVLRIHGVQPDEDISSAELFFGRIHPGDLNVVNHLYETARAQRADYESDYRIVLPDGTIKYLHTVGHPVLNESDDVIEFFGTVTDVTVAKQAEEKIKQSEMEFRQILDFAPQFVTVIASDGRVLYTNKVSLEYLGLTLEDVRADDFRSRAFHPDDLERVRDKRQNAFASGVPFENELRGLGKDGKYRWFLVRYNPLRDAEGHVLRWYVTSTDIEDRKQAEQRLQNENVALREEIDKASMFEEIVGTSPALQAVLSRISKVAPTDSSVLITGETGTGKELVARAIHRHSRRSAGAFVSVNCAAIPRDLIASELFGHEKGAFTGATQRRAGRFELAEGGTIFLDEVGELPAETQIALLRVLQEHEFERVGGTGSIQTDVRVIAATNRDLETAIAMGTFRSDLFYRLNVFPIEIPPLRQRQDDIPLLVEYFIDRYARKAGKRFQAVNKKSLDLLQSYPWPGNIRELQNVIERSVIVCESENFAVDESWLSQRAPSAEARVQVELPGQLASREKEMIEAALRECQGRVSGLSGAAAKLGLPGSTLESKIRSLNINKNRFKSASTSTKP